MKSCKGCGVEIPNTRRSNALYCSDECGSRKRNRDFYSRNKERVRASNKVYTDRWRATPRGKYVDHRNRARQCGIPFKLTFEEWWSLWEPYWGERGLGGMVMCRKDDLGGYEIGNVRIDTQANNNRESAKTGGRSRMGFGM